jgi:signal peptidase I
MSPTLVPGDRIYVSKIAYRHEQPGLGDIVVFHAPTWADQQQRTFIKRVLGLPGDRIAVRDGHLHRNGQMVDEPYLAEAPKYQWPAEQMVLLKEGGKPQAVERDGEVTVPEGMLVVLGDNRNENSDSHSWMAIGSDGKMYPCPFLARERVFGRAFVVVWPPGRARSLPR